MAPMPMGAGAPSSPFAMMGESPDGGAGPDQGLTEVMSLIRDASNLIKQIGTMSPTLAQETQQALNLLKQMIVKSAQQAPVQTPSSEAVPMAGS